ncbi:papain-like cysteine protease family protein [Microbulbifer mangrovi]|uniref:papain-like cysteine protease family protein n=1 Tax=Microbulbifer mangrovi TaxID=927787 RepID=UPI001300FB43|nr:papain-like cysteine protease family protein [Microbulbifer mangrovi]
MITIKQSFDIEKIGEEQFPNEVIIEVVFPQYSFRLSGGTVERYVSEHKKYLIVHDTDNEEYLVHLPLTRVVGKKVESIYGFFLYHLIEILGPGSNINDFSIPFTVYIRSTTGQEIGSKSFEGIIYKKKSLSSDYDQRNYREEKIQFESTYGLVGNLNEEGLNALPLDYDRSTYLINKETFELVKYALNTTTHDHTVSDQKVLELIDAMVDLSDGHPRLFPRGEIISYTQLSDLFQDLELTITAEIFRSIQEIFEKLFDFPLSLERIKTIDVIGQLEIVADRPLSLSDFDYYELSIEYPQKNGEIKIIRYNWHEKNVTPENNRLGFSFDTDKTIIANNVAGHIYVRVKDYQGISLLAQRFGVHDETLQDLDIRVHMDHQVISAPSPTTGSTRTKRLRGRVIQSAKKYSLNDLTIILQAKQTATDEIFRIIGATQTDKSGNFSMEYPYGQYAQARALVSIMPESPVEIAVDPYNANESIVNNFIFLLLSDDAVVEESETDEETIGSDEDCDCNEPRKAHRLPDQEDLIASGEYTQDIGGSCINLSTPNRTIREYQYNAIVRTSDPDVANYVLEKLTDGDKVMYNLVGGTEKIARGIVDLDNPIRWEDAPDSKENLSIYQAVTVATGHIIHFKSVFKADGYSLGDLVYSLPLAPGQKKQIVVFESSHTLQGAESQSLSQGESLSAGLVSDRIITDQLSGGINESLAGRSNAHTSGMSAGLGASGSYGGIGASLGVAGGFANSNSSASQNSARNISQFFGEKLRQSLMQNAESYRELNASVVTTVTEGQKYGVTSEVIANHNHCHSLTMMYFDVLRHFAIYQEVSHVEECLFVPLLLTHFSTENIHKWKDILADNLLPIPSSTYLKWNRLDFLRFGRTHPLIKGFDANTRIKTNYERVDFPTGTHADDPIRNITGEFTLRVKIDRPKTRYDRILSFPRVTRTIENQEFDPVETAKAWFNPFDWNKTKYRTTHETVFENARIFDNFMQLDADFQNKKPAEAIRVINFEPVDVATVDDEGAAETITVSGVDFFEGDIIDRQIWEAYADILGHSNVFQMLNNYFRGSLISEWDQIFKNQILPDIFEKILDTIRIQRLSWDLNNTTDYRGGERKVRIRITSGSYSGTRRSLPDNLRMYVTSSAVSTLRAGSIRLDIENVRINYTTAYHDGTIFKGYLGDDLIDGTRLYIPLNDEDLRNPRKEDTYIVTELIEHLNSNLEHYNKILWANLDKDRRHLLLDGFNIQTFTSSGARSSMRSLASVVKNEIITISGNSLVFPVAEGFKVNRNAVVELTIDEAPVTDDTNHDLLEMYKPLTPIPPYRISVPTRGVFMEAIQGNCDACEMVKENSSQDWDKFRTEEPTPIQPIVTPTPVVTEYKPEYKDFAQPIVNIQNSPDQPAPAAGLASLGEQLTKAGVFNDVTGLAKNQDNAIRTYLSNQENAKAFAEMSKSLATQQHNTSHSSDIGQGIERARRSGVIDAEDARDLTRQHLQQQIDGGEYFREQEQFEREQSRPSLTSVASDAVSRGQTVQAERTDSDGTSESIDVQGTSSEGFMSVSWDVEPMQQPTSKVCWATAAAMLMNWKNGISSPIQDTLTDAGNGLTPPDESYYLSRFEANESLPATEKLRFISALNMHAEAPASYPLSQYFEWLSNYGPLWVTIDAAAGEDFSPHAKILTAIEGDTMTFINPASGRREHLLYDEFAESFEEIITDLPEGETIYLQVVRFSDLVERATSSEGQARELYRNSSIGVRLRPGDTIQGHRVNVGSMNIRIGGITYTLRKGGSHWGIKYGGRNIAAFRPTLEQLATDYRAETGPEREFKALAALGFEVVSEHEGKITAINSWDNQDFTWGAGYAASRLNSMLQYIPSASPLVELMDRIPWLRGRRFNQSLFQSGPEHLDVDNFHLLTNTIHNNSALFRELTRAQARQFVEHEVMNLANTPDRQAMMSTIATSTVAPVIGVAGYLNHGRPAYAPIPVEMLNAAITEGGGDYSRQISALMRIYLQTVNRYALRMNREDRLELIYQTLAFRVPNKIKAFNEIMRNSVSSSFEFDFREAHTILPCIDPDHTMALLSGPDSVRVSPLRMWLRQSSAYEAPNISMNYDTTSRGVREYRGYYNLGAPLAVPES